MIYAGAAVPILPISKETPGVEQRDPPLFSVSSQNWRICAQLGEQVSGNNSARSSALCGYVIWTTDICQSPTAFPGKCSW